MVLVNSSLTRCNGRFHTLTLLEQSLACPLNDSLEDTRVVLFRALHAWVGNRGAHEGCHSVESHPDLSITYYSRI